MALRDWSGRRIALIWTIVVLAEGVVFAVSAYHSRDIRAQMRKRERDVGITSAAAARDWSAGRAETTSTGLILYRTNPRADSLRDSIVKLMGRIFADSGVQRQLGTAFQGASEAAGRAVMVALIIMLPLPIAATVITLFWMWGRRSL